MSNIGSYEVYGYDHAGAGPSAWRGDLRDGMIYTGGAWHKIQDILVWTGSAWHPGHQVGNSTATTSAGTDTSVCQGAQVNTTYRASFTINTDADCKLLLLHWFINNVYNSTVEYNLTTSPACPLTNFTTAKVCTQGQTVGVGLEAYRFFGGWRATTKTQLASVTVRNTPLAPCTA